ncbi:tail fiber protein [Photorhabdus luminescens subsp. luminescens]|uniref:Phage tail fibre repeat-containing protein n=1 Tax=Photorhabdus luminescens TaxID=29488 RepID=A0A1G5Q2G5_PHOLU|nr:phage tail protein [Photorhabdus luminescens]KMW72257.1 tail fiber protein [Photorhabdus luminescens subsp. luminescens]SCZ56064.1 Phage tail fibre repeat-containing protein [Photorhabdus luminescens]
MSPKNDFKAFSTSSNANVVSQERYEESLSLYSGFPPDNVPTHLLNKVLRQSSTIASIVANFIATQSGSDILDDGDTAKLTIQLNKALEQKITTQIPDASLVQKGVVQLTNVVGNSNTLAATQKLVSDINDRINQIPNMSSFTANLTQNGWQKLPSGLIEMWGMGNASYGGYLNNFPIPFPNQCLNVTLTHYGYGPQSAGVFSVIVENQQQFKCYRGINDNQPYVLTYFRAVGY